MINNETAVPIIHDIVIPTNLSTLLTDRQLTVYHDSLRKDKALFRQQKPLDNFA